MYTCLFGNWNQRMFSLNSKILKVVVLFLFRRMLETSERERSYFIHLSSGRLWYFFFYCLNYVTITKQLWMHMCKNCKKIKAHVQLLQNHKYTCVVITKPWHVCNNYKIMNIHMCNNNKTMNYHVVITKSWIHMTITKS